MSDQPEAYTVFHDGPRASYLTVTEQFNLNDACRIVHEAYIDDTYGIYHVGSSLLRPTYRDVDLRCIMPDEDFAKMFGKNVARLKLLNTTISEWLARRTGLPIDFQFQGSAEAKQYKGQRNATGHRLQCGE